MQGELSEGLKKLMAEYKEDRTKNVEMEKLREEFHQRLHEQEEYVAREKIENDKLRHEMKQIKMVLGQSMNEIEKVKAMKLTIG